MKHAHSAEFPRGNGSANGNAPLERNSATALYRQIAAQLERDILAGRFSPHGKLPSEHELMQRFDVSRVTVRQAMGWLLQEGYVVKKQGKGTFVAGQRLQHDLQPLRGFYDALVAQGAEPETRLLEFAAVTRPELSACGLADSEGQCFLLRRIYRIDGVPIAMVCAYLPPEAAKVSWQQASRTPIYGILEGLLGIHIARTDVHIRAQQAGARIGQALGLSTRAALLVMERESRGANDQVKEKTAFYIHSENYEFSLSAQGPLPISSAIRNIDKASSPETV